MLLEEMIRWQVASVLMEIRGSFKWNEFKALPTLDEKLKYAEANLQELGRGSSRAAFLLSNRYVLKVALPESGEKGIGQNKGELQVFSNTASQGTVAAIQDADKNGEWLVSELARPLSSPEEFQKMTGVPWDDFVSIIRNYKDIADEAKEIQDGIKVWTRRGNDKKVQMLQKRLQNLQKTLQSPVVKGSLALINSANVMPGDIWEVDHWAKTADGRVILIDYGFTRDLANLYKAA